MSTSYNVSQTIANRINRLIGGRSPSPDMSLFSTVTHATKTYTPRTTRWTSIYTPTCVAVGRGTDNVELAITAISPRYVIGCNHAPDDSVIIGQEYDFVEAGGTVHTRTVESRVTIDAGEIGQTLDWIVGKLDSALPAGIVPALAFPATFRAEIPDWTFPQTWPGEGVFPGVALPLVGWSKDHAAYLREAHYLDLQADAPTYYHVFALRHADGDPSTPYTRIAAWDDWQYLPITGDSGEPLGVLLRQGYAMVGTLTGNNGGVSAVHHRGRINAGVASLGGSDADYLQAADLSLEASVSDFLTGTSSTAGDWRNVSGGGTTIHVAAFTAAGIVADHEITVIDEVQGTIQLNNLVLTTEVESVRVQGDVALAGTDSLRIDLRRAGNVVIATTTVSANGHFDFSYEGTLDQTNVNALNIFLTSTSAAFAGQTTLDELTVELTQAAAAGGGTTMYRMQVGVGIGL